MLYHLTLNDEIREKVRKEITYHFDKCGGQWDKLLSYDNIGELKYLNQCLLETLRISSPTSQSSTIILKEDVVMAGYKFKKDAKL